MPVLPLETTIYPEHLLDEAAPAGGGDSRWRLLHTKPRAEKALARQLARRGMAFFLPLYERRLRYRKRVVVSHLPLFPGYLFLHGEHDGRLEALRTDRVVRAIDVVDQQKLHTELRQVQQLISSGVAIAPEERLKPGMLVEITSGPLKGLDGKVLRRGSQYRFVIQVDFLGRGASCEVEGWSLRPVEHTGVASDCDALSVARCG